MTVAHRSTPEGGNEKNRKREKGTDTRTGRQATPPRSGKKSHCGLFCEKPLLLLLDRSQLWLRKLSRGMKIATTGGQATAATIPFFLGNLLCAHVIVSSTQFRAPVRCQRNWTVVYSIHVVWCSEPPPSAKCRNYDLFLLNIPRFLPVGHSGILQLLMLCSISPEQCLTRPSPASMRRRRVRLERLPQVAEQDDQAPHWDQSHLLARGQVFYEEIK